MCVVDRRKNIIRRSGENIAALEVEAVLSRHAAPTTIAVTPVPDEIRGEEVMACIVLDERYAPSEATAVELFEHCRAALAYFKAPGYVAFVDALPLTATHKPKRNEIKQFAQGLLESRTANAVLFDLRDRKRKPTA
jgi:acyl-coenzyme A synthetase/AMP-(fatty) acid ligase